MRQLFNYLKKIFPTLLWTAFFLGIFALVCFLYDVPVQPAVYAAQVALVFGALAVMIGFFRFRRKSMELEKIREDIVLAEELPEPEDSVEEVYQDMVRVLRQKMAEMEEKDRSSYRDDRILHPLGSSDQDADCGDAPASAAGGQ